ncbi:peptidoglycan-binding protein [Streptomyces sp. CHD11]|uniref:peptidoglycan-binding domain-containing protein n=1 Tax=Streptomyces sp. CHD11 TaxID=2741325 RepID=UPI001BFC204C|nr:peptidoglycan-binding domain-containing protein [Streptomyces sp. CHD11]MBT3150984.1 peptidoglycan-binding protein [Streptomyces sp. CHD11]
MKRKLASGLGALSLGAGAVLASPGAVQAAAYPTCNAQKVVSASGSLFTYQPYYTGTGSRNCQMSQGAQSNAVYALQIAIDTCYRDISRDGIFGPETRRAVRAVQDAADVGVDGVYGPVTRKAMKWPLYKGGSGSVHGCVRLGV